MSGRECVINLWENASAPQWSDADMPSIVPSATEVQEARELLRKYLRPTATPLSECSYARTRARTNA
jgi:hypothetical protein